MKESGQSKVEKEERRRGWRPGGVEPEAPRGETAADGGADYARLGEQVTAVLTTAEQAAAEIRETARQDAEQIRLDAERTAAAARGEAEALRGDADAYRDQTRAAADTYAKETRRVADEEAAKARSALEEEARTARADAERKAREIEAEALRRRDALRESAAHLEERIAGMLTAFRGMTMDLEELLPTKAAGRDGEPDAAADEPLGAESFEAALKPDQAASR